MDLAYELHDLVRTLDRHADEKLRAESLGYNRYVALIIVDEHPGISGRELAGALGVSDAAVSGIVRKLHDAGLIDELDLPGTGRVRRWRLTEAGVAKHARCERLLGDSLDTTAAAAGIDTATLASTIRALHDAVRARRIEGQS
ncbi:MarR family winged helix-turn-helix transcriptional regulator [Gordonia sp. (in: high G+C Gram-positive bacteria)]|uniref:MarR family winged helix-turn-helix transcriptional regulator n=1 Tax=Gordonia sp. (in: high G+C Gram-positive bacteria) TaxID=84139 RepID=UPI003F99230A